MEHTQFAVMWPQPNLPASSKPSPAHTASVLVTASRAALRVLPRCLCVGPLSKWSVSCCAWAPPACPESSRLSNISTVKYSASVCQLVLPSAPLGVCTHLYSTTWNAVGQAAGTAIRWATPVWLKTYFYKYPPSFCFSLLSLKHTEVLHTHTRTHLSELFFLDQLYKCRPAHSCF